TANLYSAPDVTIKLETNDGSSSVDINDSSDNNIFRITSDGDISADEMSVSTIQAVGSGGLALLDDGNNPGLFIKDGGNVEVGAGKSLTIADTGGRQFSIQYQAYPEVIIQNKSGGKWTRFTEATGKNVLGIWNSGDSSGVIISTKTPGATYFPPAKGLWVQGNVGIGNDNYGNTATTLEVAGSGSFTGSVGIGTTQPSADLEIYSGSSDRELKIAGTGSNSWNARLLLSRSAALRAAGIWITDRSATESDSFIGVPYGGGGITFGYGTSPEGKSDSKMFLSNGGNLGIGTTNPTQKLEVAGIVKSSGVYARGADGLKLYNDGGEGIFITDGGRVGIGSNSPGQKLDIAGGSIRLDDGQQLDFGDNYRVLKYQSGSPQYMSLQSPEDLAVIIDNNNTGSINKFSVMRDSTNPAVATTIFSVAETGKVYSSGNIGIGTTNPTAAIWVSTTTGKGDIYLSGGLNGAAYGLSLTGGHIGGTYGTWNGGGATVFSNYDHKFKFINIGTGVYDVEISSGGSFIGAEIKAIDSTGLKVYDDGGNGLFVQDGGNVGIGTTNPSEKLHVIGDILSSATIQAPIGDFTDIYVSTIRAHSPIIIANETNNVLFTGAGNVGIGTGAPIGPLEVYSTDNNTPIRLTATSGTPQTFNLYSATGANSLGTGFYIQDVTASGAVRLKINADGNVGIGTTNPTNKLQIGGASRITISSTSYSLIGTLNADGADNTRIVLSGYNRPGYGGRIDYTLAQNGIDPNHVFWKGSTELMRLTGAGNLGIGTSNPSAMLDISKDLPNGTRIAKFYDTSMTQYGGEKVYLHLGQSDSNGNTGEIAFCYRANDDTYNYMQFGFHSSANLYLQNNTGHVGIGITNPAAPLFVEGSEWINSGWVGSSTDYWDDYFYYGGEVNRSPTETNYEELTIVANGSIGGRTFYTWSDKRIKNILDYPKPKSSLELVNKLKVADYKYKDAKERGKYTIQKGFIAQEVEEVCPEAITDTIQYIPDIYSASEKIQYDKTKGELTIVLDKEHELKKGDQVRIMMKTGRKDKEVSKVISSKAFIVNYVREEELGDDNRVFVYGKQVNDFKTIEYDYLYAMGIGAIQELSKELEDQKNIINSLQKEINDLKKNN
ncbi:MAG: tail fiber domain-containing protein, partial [Elusimicrobiota bacterium]